MVIKIINYFCEICNKKFDNLELATRHEQIPIENNLLEDSIFKLKYDNTSKNNKYLIFTKQSNLIDEFHTFKYIVYELEFPKTKLNLYQSFFSSNLIDKIDHFNSISSMRNLNPLFEKSLDVNEINLIKKGIESTIKYYQSDSLKLYYLNSIKTQLKV